MSSRDEKKARALKRMMKKQARVQLKRKRGTLYNDDDNDSNEDENDGRFMATPKEVNDRDNNRLQLSSKMKAAAAAKKKKKTRGGNNTGESVKFNFDKNTVVTVSTSSYPLSLVTWSGPAGEASPSDELKADRRRIGVTVRGNLSLCPPPISSSIIPSTHIPAEIASALKSLGFLSLTPVQQQSLPALLSGANVLSIAPTGSGKTYAYGLPMLAHILSHIKHLNHNSSAHSPIALVIVPTRELSIQVAASFKLFSRLFHINTSALYGGQDRESQMEAIAGTLHAAVCTPGRLIDLIKTKNISLFNVSYLVLDEADRMLALGFIDQLSFISQHVRSDRQSVLFSATFPGKLRDAASEWVKDALFIRCSSIDMTHPKAESKHTEDAYDEKNVPAAAEEGDDEAADGALDVSQAPHTHQSLLTLPPSITQQVHVCAAHKKPRLLLKCISKIRETEKISKVRQPGAMLIFCTKIKTLKFVEDFLKRQNVAIKILHGQLPQNQRENILSEFKAGKQSTICATDVAARGIHIKRLKYVINYDFPVNLEQYCHRVGRTGRQGEEGTAYSFITRNMAPLVPDLVTLLESCKQTVEPNLLLLRDEFARGDFVEGEEDETKIGDDDA